MHSQEIQFELRSAGFRRGKMIYIIAYGNPMRADDGFAWKAAELLEPLDENCRLLVLYQLSPELAEELSQAQGAIFLDARRGEIAGELFCELVSPENVSSAFTHTLTPSMLMAYAKGLYGNYPVSYLVSVTGQEWGFSPELTEPVARVIPAAVQCVKELLAKMKSSLPTASLS
jgi:hydrogenase maturation protease